MCLLALKKNYHRLWYELQESLILLANHTSAKSKSVFKYIYIYLFINQKVVFTFEIPNYINKFYLYLIYSTFLKKTLAK